MRVVNQCIKHMFGRTLFTWRQGMPTGTWRWGLVKKKKSRGATMLDGWLRVGGGEPWGSEMAGWSMLKKPTRRVGSLNGGFGGGQGRRKPTEKKASEGQSLRAAFPEKKVPELVREDESGRRVSPIRSRRVRQPGGTLQKRFRGGAGAIETSGLSPLRRQKPKPQ